MKRHSSQGSLKISVTTMEIMNKLEEDQKKRDEEQRRQTERRKKRLELEQSKMEEEERTRHKELEKEEVQNNYLERNIAKLNKTVLDIGDLKCKKNLGKKPLQLDNGVRFNSSSSSNSGRIASSFYTFWVAKTISNFISHSSTFPFQLNGFTNSRNLTFVWLHVISS